MPDPVTLLAGASALSSLIGALSGGGSGLSPEQRRLLNIQGDVAETQRDIIEQRAANESANLQPVLSAIFAAANQQLGSKRNQVLGPNFQPRLQGRTSIPVPFAGWKPYERGERTEWPRPPEAVVPGGREFGPQRETYQQMLERLGLLTAARPRMDDGVNRATPRMDFGTPPRLITTDPSQEGNESYQEMLQRLGLVTGPRMTTTDPTAGARSPVQDFGTPPRIATGPADDANMRILRDMGRQFQMEPDEVAQWIRTFQAQGLSSAQYLPRLRIVGLQRQAQRAGIPADQMTQYLLSHGVTMADLQMGPLATGQG